MRRRIVVALALAILGASCSSNVTTPTMRGPFASAFVLAPTAANEVESEAVYVSLPPDSIPGGISAVIRDTHTGTSASVPMVNGGFDPIAILAATGDTLDIAVQQGNGAVSFVVAVPKPHPPRIVRTDPPANKRDVPLNASLAVVFSQPIDPGSLTGASVQLVLNNTPVNGTLTFTNDIHTTAQFTPAADLVPNTTYQLTVTSGIHGTDGSTLDLPATVSFTTGESETATTGAASISISSVAVALQVGGEVLLAATVKDSGGQIISDASATWATSNPGVATVSTAGVIQAIGSGTTTITASYGELSATCDITVIALSGQVLPVVDVLVGPSSSPVAVGSTLPLAAVAQDSRGEPHAVVFTWTSSAPTIALVSPSGVVTGVSPGSAVISATAAGVVGRTTLAADSAAFAATSR